MSEVKTGKMKTYKIRVTKADIRKGKPQKNDACPVYLAVSRKIVGVVSVDADDIWLGADPMPMPRKAGKWIERFDEGKLVKPFSFTLKVP